MEDKLSLEEINTNTKEGRYLMAALAKLTTESQTDKTPYEVLNQCHILQEQMFSGKPFDNSLTNWTPITGEASLPKDEDNDTMYLFAYFINDANNTLHLIQEYYGTWEGVKAFRENQLKNHYTHYTRLTPPVK